MNALEDWSERKGMLLNAVRLHDSEFLMQTEEPRGTSQVGEPQHFRHKLLVNSLIDLLQEAIFRHLQYVRDICQCQIPF